MTIDDVLSCAQRQSIIIGERHEDRRGLRISLELILRAQHFGYRVLGVEICPERNGGYRGLDEELSMIRELGSSDKLTEYDARSYLEVDTLGRSPRVNRHWQMRAAMDLGWDIIPIDPFHWSWMRNDEDGYTHLREPSMAAAIRAFGPMLAIVGYGHLLGLKNMLGSAYSYVVCSTVNAMHNKKSFWYPRIQYASTVEQLTIC